MAKKIPLVRIGVQREGKTIYPEIGVVFEFTKEELTDLNRLSGETKVDYFRDPVNEDSGETPSKKVVGIKTAGGDSNL